MGRVSFSQEIADAICERIAMGESMRAICRDEGMPHLSTVCRWMDADETFAIRCAHARVLQADRVDEDIVEVIDEVRDGRLDPQAARVALAGMQWRASKLAPKKYGDRLDVNTKLSGGVELKVVTEFGE